jgi:hypothetical protein
MTEREEAIALAHRVLDKPYIDPDGDICLLARQLLRSEEREATLAKKLEEADAVIFHYTTDDRKGGMPQDLWRRLREAATARHASRSAESPLP